LVHRDGIRVKFVYEGHRVKVKVTRAEKRRKSLFPQRKISIGQKHRVVKFSFIMGFSGMADQMV